MQNKIHTQTKDTQNLSSTFSHIPVQGMFQLQSSIVQQKQQDNLQQPNLKTSLMQAERYGHHLQHTHPNKQTKTQELPIQQRTLVIGGPANTTLEQIGNPEDPSHDAYIGNAYKYVNSQEDKKYDNGDVLNRSTDQTNITHHTDNLPLRIPDKFGGREEKGKGWKKTLTRLWGNFQGTHKHGPSFKKYQPSPTNQQYLNNLDLRGQETVPTLHIVAHGTKSGKIGGYKPKELAKLLVKTGLQPGQQGNIDLRACLSATPGNKHKKSPALKLKNELEKKDIHMDVRGFKQYIRTGQLMEDSMPDIKPGEKHSHNVEKTAKLVAAADG